MRSNAAAGDLARHAPVPSLKAARAGNIDTTNNKLGSQAASRGTISIFNKYNGSAQHERTHQRQKKRNRRADEPAAHRGQVEHCPPGVLRGEPRL